MPVAYSIFTGLLIFFFYNALVCLVSISVQKFDAIKTLAQRSGVKQTALPLNKEEVSNVLIRGRSSHENVFHI